MLQLGNNCRIGKITVSPANWKTVRANPKAPWYISYYFYDDNLNQKKKVILKGMNAFTTLKEKQEAVKLLMEDEMNEVVKKGYNKITKQYALQGDNEISEYTPFIEALNYACKRVKISHNSTLILKSCLKYITMAAEQKHYDKLPVGSVKRRHIVLLFEKIEEIKKKEGLSWSAHSFNSYRSYLGILYKELIKLDIVQANMGYTVEKQTVAEKIRETLTQDQRKQINDYLFDKYYTFWRLVHIFFHSASRETEILAVRKEDIDLVGQRFKVTVKKGKKGVRQEWRTINNMVLPLWQELMNEAKSKQYLFSKGLQPGDKPIRTEQLKRRWSTHVKGKLGVTADLYSLKHSYLDEVAKLKGLKAAQELAGHSNSKITKVYAFGEDLREQAREHEFLKEVNNKFA